MGAYESRRVAAPRRFIRTFLALVLPALAFFVAFSILENPVQGDLTRVGGYSENDFGWTATHKRFAPPLVSSGYNRPHDIVIVGDSYSAHGPGQQTDPGAYWANHLAKLSGLSVAVVSIHFMTIRDLLEHPVFRTDPPQAVILQLIERYIIRNLVIETSQWVGDGFDDCPVPGPSPRVALRSPIEVEPVAWQRDTRIDFNFARAVDVMWESAWRRLGIVGRTTAYSLPLDNRSSFSTAMPDRLLVYEDEFRETDWPLAEIAAALCRLRAIQVAVEANGKTAFLFVPAPNKLTVYAPHVADQRYRGTSKLAAIEADPYVNQVRLLAPMREAVRCGAVDLYLPNDTHWGTPGHELVARTTMDALRGHRAADRQATQCAAEAPRAGPG